VVAVLAGSLVGAAIWVDRGELLHQQAHPSTVPMKPRLPYLAIPRGLPTSCRAGSAIDAEGLSARVAGINRTVGLSRPPGGPIERVEGLSDAEWCLAHVPVSLP
jgi:hypothetical protein